MEILLWILAIMVGVPAIVAILALAGIGAIFITVFKNFQLKP